MKNLKILLLILFPISIFGQNPVIGLADYNGDDIIGAYYKDVNNLLNPFQGTYVYANGNREFKIILVKKLMQYNGEYYEDLVIGEYQYKINGLEIVNTLPEINTVYNNQVKHHISGNAIINNNDIEWKCPLCETNEKRFRASIRDVMSGRIAQLFMRRIIENGQQVMKVKIGPVTGVSYYDGDPAPAEFSLPKGEMTFVKQ